jgi:hypothetical protein
MSGMTTRAPLLLAAVVGALALGACGSGGGNGSGSAKSAQDKAFDGALKFAKCMRQHGVDMPDPQRTGGGIKITARGKAGTRDLDNPTMKAAQAACQKYLKAGGGKAPSPAEQAKAKAAMLAYTGCMRRHGVKIADPKFGSDGRSTFSIGGPGQTRPDSPAFKAADKACHGTLGGKGGVMSFGTGPKG